MDNCWKTSVTELIIIFRGALLSIIPWLEKAKIKYVEGESYDDWDNIANSLYENIVCSSLNGEISAEYRIAKYNFNYDHYLLLDFIEVRISNSNSKKFAFIAFQSNSSPLDNVKVAELDKMDKVVGYTFLKFEDLEFVFVKNNNGKKEIVENLEIEL